MKAILYKKIEGLLQSNSRIIIAIDGRSAAGKSSLASILKERYNCNLFHMDDFFLASSQKTQERLNEPGGNVDYLRFNEDVMKNLKKDISFSYQIFDCKVQALTEERSVSPKKLNIVEGVYSMHPLLIDSYDLKVFMDIEDHLQRERILLRNGRKMYDKFINEWIPLEDKYFRHFSIRDKAHIIIDQDQVER